MSTRCQIGFYETAEQPLHRPSALIYVHDGGAPDTPHGVLEALLPWAEYFHTERGLENAEYAGAQALAAIIRYDEACITLSPRAGYDRQRDDTAGYGICGDCALHGDIEYYYRVDPSSVTVYAAGDGGQDVEWRTLREVAAHPIERVPLFGASARGWRNRFGQ
jgi:hypothetical protein